MTSGALVCLVLCSSSLWGPPLSAQARPKTEVVLGQESVDVPFDHANGHVNVTVALNGEGAYRFQVDTYASVFAAVNDDLARELGLEVVGQWPNSDGSQIVMRDVVRFDSIEMGGVTLRNVPALVDDYDFVPTPGGSLQGLIGFPALQEHLVTFDYPASRLRFEPGALEADEQGTLPFVTTMGGPDLRLDVGGKPVIVGIDTGADAGLLLDRRHAERLGLGGSLVKVGEARTVYTTQAIERGLLPEPLRLGGHAVLPATALFLDFPTPRGLLGHEVLRSYAVTFDSQQRLVRFLRAPAPPTVALSEAERARWVGTYEREDERHVLRLDEGQLVYVRDELPPQATLTLSAGELQLAGNVGRLALETDEDGTRVLVLRTHALGDPVRARRME